MKEFLSHKGVKFAYCDISLELGHLKRFLKIRDSSSLFDPAREAGGIGIPTIIVDGEIMVGFDREKLEQIIK